MARITVFQEQALTFSVSGSFGSVELSPAPFVLTEGETYLLALDGVEHECICDTSVQGVPGIYYIPGYGVDGDPTVGTCYVVYGSPEVSGTEGGVVAMSYISDTTEDTEVHTLAIYQDAETSGGSVCEYLIQAATLTAIADAIREKTGGAGKLNPTEFPDAIRGITTGGGSSADVRYVTFMNHDGTVEYGKKAVAVGDDCTDPLARGVFTTPTRESDVQYSYTFYGWANEANGAADSEWNKSVTEDKTVYANFAAAVRYYTVTYYDSDGTTVLKTESLPYGATPSYVAEKEGYNFEGWDPTLTPVTGNVSYSAKWSVAITFAGASWADIAAISASGEATKHFAVGDTKKVPITYADGTTGSITVVIAGFGIDDLTGGGKAGITVVCRTMPNYKVAWGEATYKNSQVNAALQDGGAIWNMLPSGLLDVVKNVDKQYDASFSSGATPTLATLSTKLWLLSMYEFGQSTSYGAGNIRPGSDYHSILGYRYPLYPINNYGATDTYITPPIAIIEGADDSVTFTRSLYRVGVVGGSKITSTKVTSGIYHGKYKTFASTMSQSNMTSEEYGVCFGFCI